MDLLKTITPVHTYFLDLLSMEYVDFDNSFIDSNGNVYFRLNIEKFPVPNIEVPIPIGTVRKYTSVNGILQDELFETTFFKHGETCYEKRFAPKLTDEYFIQFLPDKCKSDSFAIKHNDRMYARTHEYISGTLYLMKETKHPKFQIFNIAYDKFNRQAAEWVKGQIRMILTDLKGKYVKDDIDHDTYFLVRRFNEQDIYYIIYRWWDKVRQGKVVWIDTVNGEGTVYTALND